jgi:transcriptional regulator with XRE-family HTH domain
MTGKESLEGWDDFARELGLRMQRRRLQLALSQEHVAYAAGLTRSHYQQLERGHSGPTRLANPSLKTLVSLCVALDTTLSELLPPDYIGISKQQSAA